MRPLSLLLSLLALLSHWPAAAAETATPCPEIAEDAARLACFDAEATAGDRALLVRLLGDPEALGKDYAYLGNGGAVRALLPGRWLIQSWENAAALLSGGLREKACSRNGLEIAASAEDDYAVTVTATGKDDQRFELYDILWLGGSTFALVRNLEQSLAFYRLDPERMGYGPVMHVLNDAATAYTFLTLSDETLLAIAGGSGHALVLLRCPAPG